MPIYQGIYDGPARNYSRDRDGDPIVTEKRYITIHNTSNDATAEGEASYAKRRTDSTSSHYYVDGNSIVQSLDTDWRAWHVGSVPGNDRGISYEITGINGWTRAQWLDRVAWGLLATQIRKDCKAHNIAVRRLTVAQIKAGDMTGFITHNDARLAWGGTDHTDPGPNFPMDHLLALVAGDEEDDVTPEDIAAIAEATAKKLKDHRYPRADGKPDGITLPTSADWARHHAGGAKAAILETLVPGQAAILAAVSAGSGLTEAQLAAAVAEGVREALPDWLQVAQTVAGLIDHDLDVTAVAEGLREFYGDLAAPATSGS